MLASPIVVRINVAAPPTPISNPGSEHKPILAERFKTKMCRNYELTGACPYEVRCMFAHGEEDLRTKAMNLADNLVTEDAIKSFQRARYAHLEETMDGECCPATHHQPSSIATPPAYHCAPQQYPEIRSTSPVVYRHDPYAQFSAWQPLSAANLMSSQSTNSGCDCSECYYTHSAAGSESCGNSVRSISPVAQVMSAANRKAQQQQQLTATKQAAGMELRSTAASILLP